MMNYGMIVYLLGYVCCFEAGFLALPLLVSLFYGEAEGGAYLAIMILCGVIGFVLTRKKPKKKLIYGREGLVTVALSWIILSAFGALPFIISGDIPNVMDALFETASGFTTTGASILNDVEALSQTGLFWRSFTHWIGGMGVLVFMLAILPTQAGGVGLHIMRAESPGPSVSKLVPRVRSTAKILYGIYIFMTILASVIFLCGGMSFFDAVTTAFSTAGTGGFAVRRNSMAGYTPFLQVAVAVFVLLFGVNFQLYYLAISGRIKQAVKSTELWVYMAIVVITTGIVSINILPLFDTVSEAVRHGFFQVASLLTSTGFATTDYNEWPEICRVLLLLVMFCGACAGSTSGGIKLSRLIILAKEVRAEIGQLCHPRSVRKVRMDGHVISQEVRQSTYVFLILYVALFVASLVVLSFDGKDMITNISAVAATINNVGAGLEAVGPTGNYGDFSNLSKGALIFNMIAGRLELIPIVMLFIPRLGRR